MLIVSREGMNVSPIKLESECIAVSYPNAAYTISTTDITRTIQPVIAIDDDPDVIEGCSFRPAMTLCIRWKAVARFSRSEEHTSELQSLMRISYAVFCLKKKNQVSY